MHEVMTEIKRIGRPGPPFTEELAGKICERITGGESLLDICRDDDMPSRSTVLRWQYEFPAFEAAYARAREGRGDWRTEKMRQVIEDMRNGDIDPHMAKVELDMQKWLAGKDNPRKYGDSTTIKGDKDNPLTIQALATALDDRMRTRIEHKDDDV